MSTFLMLLPPPQGIPMCNQVWGVGGMVRGIFSSPQLSSKVKTPLLEVRALLLSREPRRERRRSESPPALRPSLETASLPAGPPRQQHVCPLRLLPRTTHAGIGHRHATHPTTPRQRGARETPGTQESYRGCGRCPPLPRNPGAQVGCAVSPELHRRRSPPAPGRLPLGRRHHLVGAGRPCRAPGGEVRAQSRAEGNATPASHVGGFPPRHEPRAQIPAGWDPLPTLPRGGLWGPELAELSLGHGGASQPWLLAWFASWVGFLFDGSLAGCYM